MRSAIAPALLVAMLFLQTLSGATFKSGKPPARPSNEQWDSYRKVQAAIDDTKRQGEKVQRPDVVGWLAALDWLDTTGKKEYTQLRFDANYTQPYQVRDLKTFENTPYSPVAGPTGTAAETSANTGFFAGPKGSAWQGIKIRQSYSEVLAIEDPSQDSTKKVDSLQGGLFSYTKNYLTDGDSLSLQGAFILPLVWQRTTRLNPQVGLSPTSSDVEPDYSHWVPISWGIIPSVSIYRVTNAQNIPNTTLKKDVDQLTWRVGWFEKLSVPSHILDTLTLRVYGVYATDTAFESSAPAGQLEIEPQAFFNSLLTLGYITQLIPKTPAPNKDGEIDESDNSYLAYQLRIRGHAEYGTVIDPMTNMKKGAFFRAGPIAEIRFDPVILKGLNVSCSYEYLPAVTGSNEHNTLLTTGAEYKLIDNQKTHQSLSLKVTYTEGGLEITKQDVRTLVTGIGIIY